ncbi:hypothetical protein HXF18_14745 [Listeria monocytogenes]|uniref:Uncharacterized protein n=1 Tax=Listeria monocytogenes serotype 1/2b TaxID=2291966 RepID=A0A823FKX5_LISMN|nr:hypothetical protein [Listeria monocytogenes]EAE3706985.1 hypothetical protein [Listeria monocytogenes serotype 1/2b]EAC5130248.1 hypothetical protein [Listeria monocytogenes]EAD3684277.1 hypothetical protein [Listeria monocytogenes]EAD3699732.1 hypothetical protein [Listeria monocytogenes]EAE3719144.1 hypothetical protein [Listeria monocytogenes serotype 1/2b]
MIPPFKIAEDEFIAISTAEELLEYIKHADELISVVRESRSKAYKELADRGLHPFRGNTQKEINNMANVLKEESK